ncbi:hypothetical protein HY489_05315 [Candidatus Woesearchaeota archaeon]|nr:hypothetical protein [Candidatus Woesearchaeota archaeon]
MNRIIMLILLLALPVSALYDRVQYTTIVTPEQYDSVTCEREKRIGAISAIKERLCCINKDKNAYCSNDEPVLGTCDQNLCVLPTATYKPAYTTRYTRSPCTGLSILTGPEHHSLLTHAGCAKTGQHWCCPANAFPPLTGLAQKPGMKKPGPNPEGALLVVGAQKWRGLELGLVTDKYAQRAYEHEQERCAQGGGEVKIINKSYGSFFADTRNIKPGIRAFFIKPNQITPLITWC